MTANKQALHSFEDGRLSGVFLTSGYAIEEHPQYGTCVSYEDIFALTEQVAVALALRPGRLRGVEFQYIRKALQWPRSEVARRFGRTELTISNWESRNKVPVEASLLMKQNCLRHFGFSNAIERVLDQQGEEGFSSEQIEMYFANGQWSSNFHPKAMRNTVHDIRKIGIHPPKQWAEAVDCEFRSAISSAIMKSVTKVLQRHVHVTARLPRRPDFEFLENYPVKVANIKNSWIVSHMGHAAFPHKPLDWEEFDSCPIDYQ